MAAVARRSGELDTLARTILAEAEKSMALAQAGQFVTSPPAAAYSDWTFGAGAPAALPRDPVEFLLSAFGPREPRTPVPIDGPPPGYERPEPRRWEYPPGWNLSGGKPGTEGLKLASFLQLRAFADSYSIVRAAIEVRKQEILGIEWEITPTRDARLRMKENPGALEEWTKRKDEATAFFSRPDPEYQNYSAWMSAALEELFVTDSLSLYVHPSRLPGHGVLGSSVAALDLIDGTTIRPVLDVRGGKPKPPNPAYQQFLWGVPRVDMMSVILGNDFSETPNAKEVREYRGDQLLYLPYIRRSWTPYGFPGLERALLPVVTGLKQQQFVLEFFTEGSIPGMFVVPGPGIDTPEQIRKLQDTLNYLAGDQAWKHKIIVLPHGSSSEQHKAPELATQFDETIVVQTCMAYEVQPNEIGFPMGMNSKGLSIGGSATAAEVGDDARQRKATKPLLRWLKVSVFDFMLQQVFGQDDMEWTWIGWQDEDDMSQKADRMMKEVIQGGRTIDEYRTEVGLDPFGHPLTSTPILISTRDGGITPLEFLDPSELAEGFDNPASAKYKKQDAQATAAEGITPAGEETQEPVDNSKAVTPELTARLDELEKLRRAIKKRPSAASTWKAEHLPQEVVDKVAGGMSIDEARVLLRILTPPA